MAFAKTTTLGKSGLNPRVQRAVDMGVPGDCSPASGALQRGHGRAGLTPSFAPFLWSQVLRAADSKATGCWERGVTSERDLGKRPDGLDWVPGGHSAAVASNKFL